MPAGRVARSSGRALVPAARAHTRWCRGAASPRGDTLHFLRTREDQLPLPDTVAAMIKFPCHNRDAKPTASLERADLLIGLMHPIEDEGSATRSPRPSIVLHPTLTGRWVELSVSGIWRGQSCSTSRSAASTCLSSAKVR